MTPQQIAEARSTGRTEGMTTIDDDLAALSAAIEAGPTPGPWKFEPSIPEEGVNFWWITSNEKPSREIGSVHGPQGSYTDADAAYIAAAGPDRIARLIAALREAQAEAKRERDWHSRVLASAQKLFGVDCIRLKLSLFGNGRARNIFPDDMDGAWVALQRAEDDGHMGLVSMLEETRARADEAREDAERYRWLTDDHGSSEARLNVFTVSESIPIRGKGATDAAIDAAMVRAARAATKGAA